MCWELIFLSNFIDVKNTHIENNKNTGLLYSSLSIQTHKNSIYLETFKGNHNNVKKQALK